ncbi:hypothetical protein PC9H_005595 [Pleurotus ostreatus]|uniref:Uncharacterized protein n=1 Tax=Pleurotus ostreatus TaxID=5322 RepID=A0A8H6ZZB1_PLEOS|nr:uncharacterized protein PC9H_005595 [Pleurotus ostreatus]KAF7433634.1 hypothetical protein PC9H_005595 [Pleurotus ostreatus]
MSDIDNLPPSPVNPFLPWPPIRRFATSAIRHGILLNLNPGEASIIVVNDAAYSEPTLTVALPRFRRRTSPNGVPNDNYHAKAKKQIYIAASLAITPTPSRGRNCPTSGTPTTFRLSVHCIRSKTAVAVHDHHDKDISLSYIQVSLESRILDVGSGDAQYNVPSLRTTTTTKTSLISSSRAALRRRLLDSRRLAVSHSRLPDRRIHCTLDDIGITQTSQTPHPRAQEHPGQYTDLMPSVISANGGIVYSGKREGVEWGNRGSRSEFETQQTQKRISGCAGGTSVCIERRRRPPRARNAGVHGGLVDRLLRHLQLALSCIFVPPVLSPSSTSSFTYLLHPSSSSANNAEMQCSPPSSVVIAVVQHCSMGNLVYLIMKPDDGYISVNARRRDGHTAAVQPLCMCPSPSRLGVMQWLQRMCRVVSPLCDMSSIGGALSFAAVRRSFRVRFPLSSRS